MSEGFEDEELEDIREAARFGGTAAGFAAIGLLIREFGNLFGFRQRSPQKSDCVKLVHADDLKGWTSFPRCQDVDTLTFGDYRAGVAALAEVRKRVASLLKAKRKLTTLDSDEVVTYHTEYVDVPRSVLRRSARIPLEHKRVPGTWLESEAGEVSMSPTGDLVVIDSGLSGTAVTRSGWKSRSVAVRSVGPSRVVHEQEIADLTALLAAATDKQRSDIAHVETSRFGHPVLFISHRWESKDHPDPTGEQLRRLRVLKECWIIYDYTSFPQLPRTEPEEAQFRQIIDCMDELIKKVIVLASPDYLTRGWLVYEYIVGSLESDIVCDEVNDPNFANLRAWTATEAPPPANLFRDGFESAASNHINRMRLDAVNRLLPVYGKAEFGIQHDSAKVTELLTNRLKAGLSPRKQSQSGLGEWKTTHWTDEDLAAAFRGEIDIPFDESRKVQPFRPQVPMTLEEAVARKYKVDAMPLAEKANPLRWMW
jgi:hypothetical protein